MSSPPTTMLARGGRQDPAGDRAQRGLAGPRRADQCDDLVAGERQRRVVEGDDLPSPIV